MIDTFAIPLTFVILCAITLWLLVGSKGWWVLKSLVVVLVFFFSISLWKSLDDLQGWATECKVPERFEVLWVSVDEPNSKTDNPGAVYLWMRDLQPKETHSWYLKLYHKQLAKEPRVHKLPYSRPLHEQGEQIKSKIAKGERFFGEMDENMEEGIGQEKDGKGGKGGKKGMPGEEGEEGGGGRAEAYHGPRQDFILHELPPPSYPEKMAQP